MDLMGNGYETNIPWLLDKCTSIVRCILEENSVSDGSIPFEEMSIFGIGGRLIRRDEELRGMWWESSAFLADGA